MQSDTVANIYNTRHAIQQINLYYPDENVLATVLENGLRRSFTHANVRWVTCPNLSQAPFNLAATGICGKAAIIEVGDRTYLEPNPRLDKIYIIREILTAIGRSYNLSYIFGNGFIQRPSNAKLGELVMNATFAAVTHRIMHIRNKSRITFMNLKQFKCDVEMLNNIEPKCNVHGTFFLCEGLTGRVLQVRVKGHSSRFNCLSGFILSMQDILKERFSGNYGKHVALGGVYIVRNALWTHTLTPNCWEEYGNYSMNYCTVNEPEVIMSTFNSNTRISSQSATRSNIFETTHCFSHHNANGLHYPENNPFTGNDMEIIGYFNPARELYRVDEPSVEHNSC
ncbi:ester hydrolase C11orf54 homolog isoform X2 [Anoplolepis gracilipes]|uniref:ester hydrolase C11orf54 homolog isoform X2 n=1 Tax=Anoplolepis gracilipes TaxID=354296 RepID=UPI003B9E50DC